MNIKCKRNGLNKANNFNSVSDYMEKFKSVCLTKEKSINFRNHTTRY